MPEHSQLPLKTEHEIRNTYSYRGNIHIHTMHSDGTGQVDEVIVAAKRTGVDFIIITDHNQLIEQTREGWRDGVLTLLDIEVHDEHLKPERNHCLTLNVQEDMTPFAPSPQGLIDAVRERGGLTFLAHPVERISPLIPVSFPWTDWDIEGYTGIEIWNFMSEFRHHVTSRPKAVVVAYFPQLFSTGPLPELLEKWDKLLQSRPTPAIGGSDAHAQTYRLGPFRRRFLPYEYTFKAVNTHILTPEPFSGDTEHDRALVYEALGAGRSWVGYDMLHPTEGFSFTARAGDIQAQMGDSVRVGPGITFEIETPVRAQVSLIRAGQGVVTQSSGTRLEFTTTEPGAYRVEAWKRWWFRSRAWIFSNPIYVIG